MCFCSENVDFLYLGGRMGCRGRHAWLPGGGCAWLLWGCVVAWGACMVAGAHAWLLGGACMVAGGHTWLPGGVHGCQGACVVAGGCAWLVGAMCGCGGAFMVARGKRGCRGACMVAAGGGVPCDLSHHAFDVTCILSPHQLRASSYAPAYILVTHVTCMPPPPVDRQTPVKT